MVNILKRYPGFWYGEKPYAATGLLRLVYCLIKQYARWV